jgi:hypothetical protein
MAIALRGNLKDFGIAEVFQLIGQQRKTGKLEITGGGGLEVSLTFDEGAVVWASPVSRREHEVLGQRLVRCGLLTQEILTSLLSESEASARSLPSLILAGEVLSKDDLEEVSDLLTDETIFEVLRWKSGQFHFSAQSVSHDRPPEKLLAAEQILMDGLRKVDEWQTFAGNFPSDETVFQRRDRDAAERKQLLGQLRGSQADADKLLQLVDGRSTLGRVIDLSRLGRFDATRILVEMIEMGMIASVQSRASRSTLRARGSGASIVAGLRAAARSALPLILLAAAIGLIEHRSRTQPLRSEAFPITHPTVDEAKLLFEKRRLRHVLAAQRLRAGNWPENLQQKDETGLLDRESLAPASGPAYYYGRQGTNIVLLSPDS